MFKAKASQERGKAHSFYPFLRAHWTASHHIAWPWRKYPRPTTTKWDFRTSANSSHIEKVIYIWSIFALEEGPNQALEHKLWPLHLDVWGYIQNRLEGHLPYIGSNTQELA